jgi:nucleoid DNA-binding protein
MLTRDFVNAVAARVELPAETVRAVLAATQDVAVAQLQDKGVVRVPGIAQLRRIERNARMARNPRTGEACEVKVGFTVKARPTKRVVDRVLGIEE